MKPIGTFSAIPSLPAPIERLRNITYNLCWAWSHDSVDLFRTLDRDLRQTPRHDPVLMLGTIEQEKLEAVSRDDAFLAHLDHESDKFVSYTVNDRQNSGG